MTRNDITIQFPEATKEQIDDYRDAVQSAEYHWGGILNTESYQKSLTTNVWPGPFVRWTEHRGHQSQ